MSDRIDLEVEYSENDFVRGMRFTYDRHRKVWITRLIVGATTLIGYVAAYALVFRSRTAGSQQDYVALGVGAVIAAFAAILIDRLRGDMGFSRLYQSSPL